jgi:integrase
MSAASMKAGVPGETWTEATRYPGIRKRLTRSGDGRHVHLVYTARAYDPACKDNKKWLGSFRTEAEARRAKRDHEETVATREERDDDVETVREFFDSWAARFPRPKLATMEHNCERVGKFAVDFGERPMASVRRKEARTWALANKSRFPAVRAMFSDWCSEQDVMPANPFMGLRLGGKSRGRKDIEPLSDAQLTHLADTALWVWPGRFGQTMRALILCAAHTCMRPAELALLEYRHIDFEAEEITVELNFSGWKRVATPKNGKPRVIVLPPVAGEVLRSLPRPAAGGRIWSTVTGVRFSKGTWAYAWHPIRAAAGLPRMDFYELRHVGAYRLLHGVGLSGEAANGLPPHVVAVQLGHTDGGRLVTELYGHPDERIARQRIKQAFGTQVHAARPSELVRRPISQVPAGPNGVRRLQG